MGSLFGFVPLRDVGSRFGTRDIEQTALGWLRATGDMSLRKSLPDG